MESGERESDRGDQRIGEERATDSVGLCAGCIWVRIQGTRRGAQFYRCARADEDESYLRYPPLPVLQCRGFEPSVD